MDTQQELCGLFGKIPQQSDFVSHHLSESFTEHWHHWLQSCLSISREQLNDEWMKRYMVSPIWRFAIMPNIVSEQSVLGVMIPSVDQVGRYFPSIIAHIGNHDIWSAYLNGESWYQAIEKALLSSLSDDTTYSHLIGQLETLPLPEFETIPVYTTKASLEAFKGNKVVQNSNMLTNNQFAISLLPNSMKQRYGNHSLWWTSGSDSVSACLAISTDLPDPGQYAAMLDGQWQKWGWSEDALLEKSSEPV